MDVIQVARLIISFSWIYHGLVPKLIWVAPLEKEVTASLGLSEGLSLLVTKSAGVAEILFGMLFFFLYKNKLINQLNIIGLTGLLSFVGIFNTHLLAEAFNPVTTNLPLIGLSVVLMLSLRRAAYRRCH
jgi:hypothetical protein